MYPSQLTPEEIKKMIDALNYADRVLFDTYSNAQKLTWQEIEENCREGAEKTKQILKELKVKYHD